MAHEIHESRAPAGAGEAAEAVEVTVVLPAHNEAERIECAVEETERALSSFCRRYEIIIAEDGSTDNTAEIARKIAEKRKNVRFMHSDERLGRGRALNRAFKKARGEVLAYIDVDLSTDMRHLRELIDAIRVEKYDFATGSRLLKASHTQRSLKREAMSRLYNFLVRLLLRSKLRDHQCGFKAFSRDALFSILDEVEDKHWFWDTELLVKAQWRGFSVKEIPVHWEERSGGTKVKLLKDSFSMLSNVLKMWLNERCGESEGRRKVFK